MPASLGGPPAQIFLVPKHHLQVLGCAWVPSSTAVGGGKSGAASSAPHQLEHTSSIGTLHMFGRVQPCAASSVRQQAQGVPFWEGLIDCPVASPAWLLATPSPTNLCLLERKPNVCCSNSIGRSAQRGAPWEPMWGFSGDWPSHTATCNLVQVRKLQEATLKEWQVEQGGQPGA